MELKKVMITSKRVVASLVQEKRNSWKSLEFWFGMHRAVKRSQFVVTNGM